LRLADRTERSELRQVPCTAAARSFYERRGLRLVELTDGAGNEEREPDALYEWRPD
jgi:hypothetical protein